MNHPTINKTLAAVAMALVCTLAPSAGAQADFAEDFENNGVDTINGPTNLINAGWIFRNQCDPVNGPAWYDGTDFGGAPFDGTGFLATDALATDYFGGAFSVWAILPDIDNQQAGDEFSLWVYGGGSATYNTWMEVRYAPSGTGTGSDEDDIGDFTELLFSAEMPLSTLGYQRINAAIPGPGRIAIRFRADYMMAFAGRGFYLSVDTLTVGPSPDDPCGVPIPDVGQTVTWAAADSPFNICQDLLLPEGGTVIIEPGATVTIGSGSTLRVEGNLVAHGTAEDPIVFNGSTGFNDGLDVAVSGQADFSFTEFYTRVFGGGDESALIVTDSFFGPGAVISGIRDLIVFERCTFDGGASVDHSLIAGGIRVTDTLFSNGASAQITGVMYLDNIDLDGGQLRLYSESAAYPVFVDNITVTDFTSDAGLALQGPNFFIGDNVNLQNNLYSLHLAGLGAGVLPGSTLPLTGNANNYILADQFNLGFRRNWAHTGLDYLVAGGFPENYGGTIIVEPGATLRFGPDAGAFIIGSAEVGLQGTRENPITLESSQPFPRWFGLKWVDDFDATATHTIFDGGQITVQSDGGVMDLRNCTVQNSLEGTASVTGGIVRLHNSKIINNQVGMVTTTSGRIEARGDNSPSIFEGNAVAIEYNNNNTLPYLRYNWWGDATGPTNPLHPSGQGDVVQDVHPAAFTPYLAAPPAQDDDFPVIEMMPVFFTAHTGDKIILRWASSDDDAVVEHRIEWYDHDFPGDREVITTLPGNASTYEFVVPLVEPNNLYPTPSAIRVVAIDSAGQESSDKSILRVPYLDDWTVVPQTVETPPNSQPHDNIDFCWSPGGNATAYIYYDNHFMSSYHGGSNTGCLPIGATLPYVSTDTARALIVMAFGAGGRLEYWFSDEFEVRPDARFGDAPPVVEVTAPAADQTFTGGGLIPVRWTASDDEDIRAFHIQASYDGGRTWNFVARDLPPEASAFDWRLPPSAGIPDVRVRVVVVDKRFQDSSDTTGVVSILPGDGCRADLNSDGVLNFFDVLAFLSAFDAQNPVADFNDDALFNFFDVQEFLSQFSAGCP